MDLLTKIALRHGTDKWGSHYYTRFYDRYLLPLRDRRIVLFEIGIGGGDNPWKGGESLRLWRDYFPLATIVGLDIFDKTPQREDRIHTIQGPQADSGCLRGMVERFGVPDVVIDDGSHLRNDTFETLDTLFPLMAEDALYFIEDTQTSYWPNAQGNADPTATNTTMGRMRTLANDLNGAEIALNNPEYITDPLAKMLTEIAFSHNLCMLRRGANDEPSNFNIPRDSIHLAASLDLLDAQIASFPDNPEMFYNRARILIQMNRGPEAIEAQQRAVALSPTSYRQLGRLGDISAAATDWIGATAAYRAAAHFAGDSTSYLELAEECDFRIKLLTDPVA